MYLYQEYRYILITAYIYTDIYTYHSLQFLIESCLAARLKIADDNSQLPYIFDKFLKMLFKIVKLLRHVEKKYNYTLRRNNNKTFIKIGVVKKGSVWASWWYTFRQCTSQSGTGTVSCRGNDNRVNVKGLELPQSVVRTEKPNNERWYQRGKSFFLLIFYHLSTTRDRTVERIFFKSMNPPFIAIH